MDATLNILGLNVIVMWSVWLFLVGQEEEAAVSSPSALSRSQTGWSSASSAHAQYVPVNPCPCLTPVNPCLSHTHLFSFAASALMFSLCLCQWRASTRRISRTLRTGAVLFMLPLREDFWRSVTCSYRWDLHSLQWLLNIHCSWTL